LTDAGMTGPYDSIIGMQKEPSLDRFISGLPRRFAPASDDIKMSGVIMKVDYLSGKATHIERFRLDFNPAEIGKSKSNRSIEKEA
ncbi:MAG: YmdB family metallophosphoesterase, partial [bacterium]|nr:YmdB family metallophosphoesterase [bacterium]